MAQALPDAAVHGPALKQDRVFCAENAGGVAKHVPCAKQRRLKLVHKSHLFSRLQRAAPVPPDIRNRRRRARSGTTQDEPARDDQTRPAQACMAVHGDFPAIIHMEGHDLGDAHGRVDVGGVHIPPGKVVERYSLFHELFWHVTQPVGRVGAVPAVLVLPSLLQAHDRGDSSSRKSRRYVELRIDFSAGPLHGEAVIPHPAAVHSFESVGSIRLPQPVLVAAALSALKRAHNALPGSAAHTKSTHEM
jgi:hypothetical protein